MKPFAIAAIALAASSLAGCGGAYHPVSLSTAPFGVTAAHSRIVADQALKERYPAGADAAESRFPAGAVTPAARPAGHDWGVKSVPGWSTTALGREAERKTIARDMPHAAVSPWGTVKGH